MRISDWSSDVCSSDLENGWVNDSDSARRWLEDQLLLNLARFEAPLLLAHCEAAAQDDWPRLLQLAAEHRASRETRELQLESRQMRSEEHTSELQSLMSTSYAVFCLKKKQNDKHD